MMDFPAFRQLCESRRSIRYFSDEELTLDDILPLLELANLAPSVENTQPWHFHVLLDKKLRKEFMKASCYGNFIEGAGAFILVTCDANATPPNKEILWNPKEMEYSCACAIEHILLGAVAKGLGGSWVSLHHGAAHDILKLKPNQRIIGGLILGHLKRGEEVIDDHHERKPMEEIYTVYE